MVKVEAKAKIFDSNQMIVSDEDTPDEIKEENTIEIQDVDGSDFHNNHHDSSGNTTFRILNYY